MMQQKETYALDEQTSGDSAKDIRPTKRGKA